MAILSKADVDGLMVNVADLTGRLGAAELLAREVIAETPTRDREHWATCHRHHAECLAQRMLDALEGRTP